MSLRTSAPAMRMPGRPASHAARVRLQLAAAVVLRLLALVLAAEVSGSLHAALDIAVAVDAGVFVHPDDDCEQDGHECPPGCLSCHCGHAAAWSRPVVSALETELMLPVLSEVAVDYSASVPAGPALARLDRPPRSELG